LKELEERVYGYMMRTVLWTSEWTERGGLKEEGSCDSQRYALI